MTGAVRMVGVNKSYGSVAALAGVDLSLDGGIVGLLGPNGAGKTTMIRILATVLSPDKGALEILGRDPAKADERVEIRRRLGYMPQEPGFYRSFTVFEFVDYVAILKEINDRRGRHDEVRRVLARVGLAEAGRKKIRALSGGMRKRLALATAFLGNPDLLLLDEPTAGLDPEQRLRFREVVSQLPNRPQIVLSTHQTEDVVALCERVILLAGGRVRYDGSPATMAETARGRVWRSETPDESALLSWRMADGSIRHVGDPPPGADLAEPTIEDAYLLLAGRPALGTPA